MTLTNAPDTTLSEATETAKAIKETARTFQDKAGEVSAGLDRLTGTGLRDLKDFVADGRRTLGTIDRAVGNLDRDPKRLLFGGQGGSGLALIVEPGPQFRGGATGGHQPQRAQKAQAVGHGSQGAGPDSSGRRLGGRHGKRRRLETDEADRNHCSGRPGRRL